MLTETEWKFKMLQEEYLEKLARLIERKWDLLDMMVHEGYEVNWHKILFL